MVLLSIPLLPSFPLSLLLLFIHSFLFAFGLRNLTFTPAAVAAAAAKSIQSCPTLCNPIDGSPPGSLVPGILQARTLEWVAISFSNAWKWKVKMKSLSHVWLLATSWTAVYQAPPSMGFSRQEYWSGVPLPSPGTLIGQGFNLDAEYIMRNAGLEEAQAGIKIAGRNINNLR